MVQYLIAVWDYTAEGEFELSFKQGDRIKLLEKHNDDWWEGELNNEIGFFPANRIRLETEDDIQERLRSQSISRDASNNNTTQTFLPVTDTLPTNHNEPLEPPPRTSSVTPFNPPELPERSNNPYHNETVQEQPFAPALPPRDHHHNTIPPEPAYQDTQHMHTTLTSNNTAATNVDENLLIDISNDDDHHLGATSAPGNLPPGWQFAYDEDGTIYYFNEVTGESRWEIPEEIDSADGLVNQLDQLALSPPSDTIEENVELEQGLQKLSPSDFERLQLDRLEPQWIRHQGFVQLKVAAEKEDGGKLSSWKIYYAVLSKGFLLLYKDNYSKNKKYTKPLTPVGSFDLDGCEIDPASKHDTRRKHAFLVTTPKKLTIYIQTASENELSAWLDAIMRELIARKEGVDEDSDILRLLRMLTSDSQQMKVNRKITKKAGAKDADSEEQKGKPKKIGHWFGKPVKNNDKPTPRPTAGTTAPASENNVFGGILRMDNDGRIPRIVRLCVNEVEARGLMSVGIYRLSGPASSIHRYKALFNQNQVESLADEPDINVVTGLLKLYFRELKNPLLTFEYYDWFIDAARISDYDERMYQIKSIIHALPKENFTVLEFLMRHLNRVTAYSEVNKMEASNLALIFSVGLLRSPQEDLTSIMHADLQNKVIEAIIQQVDWFFEKEEGGGVEQE